MTPAPDIDVLTPADAPAVSALLMEAYGDYAERLGPAAWTRMREGLASAPARLTTAAMAGVRGVAGLDADIPF